MNVERLVIVKGAADVEGKAVVEGEEKGRCGGDL